MKPRGEEFLRSLGNDSPGHEFYDDVDFDEVEIEEVDKECKI